MTSLARAGLGAHVATETGNGWGPFIRTAVSVPACIRHSARICQVTKEMRIRNLFELFSFPGPCFRGLQGLNCQYRDIPLPVP